MAFDFDDWGRWGLDDWYDGVEEQLRAALASGQPFDTGWHGWRKTEYSMQIQRSMDGVTVAVHNCMDSALEEWDLSYDFLTFEECERLTDEMINQIRDYLYMGDFVEEITESETLPEDTTLEEIMQKAGELIDFCDNVLRESFRECISTTLWVMYGESEDTMRIINERIQKYCPEGE